MIEMVHRYVIPQAFDVLPAVMTNKAAAAMLLAIGLQESKFEHRRQIAGPARSFWQFEVAGVKGVVAHESSGKFVKRTLTRLRYFVEDDARVWSQPVLDAMEHNDVLACCFARLLLWTLPGSLPNREQQALGWQQYLAAWRPGKPHIETWEGHFRAAWALVDPK